MNFESRILKKRLGAGRKKRILLFLCTGDTCRNPMAAGYLQKLVKDMGIRDLEVRSAGVMTVNGLLPSDESSQMLAPFNVDISSHRSRPLTAELIQKAQLVLGMTPIHVQTALRLCEDAKGKTFLLRDYAGTSEGKNSQVNDPMGCTLEVYKNCFKLIKKACDQLVKKSFIKELLVSKSPAKKTEEKAKPKKAAAKPAAEQAKAKKAPTKKKAVKKEVTKKAAAKKAAKKKVVKKAASKKAAVKKSAAKVASKKKASKTKKSTAPKKKATKAASTKKKAVKKTATKKTTAKKAVKSTKKAVKRKTAASSKKATGKASKAAKRKSGKK